MLVGFRRRWRSRRPLWISLRLVDGVSRLSGFERRRGHVSQRRVTTNPVVKHLDGFEHGPHGVGPGGERHPVQKSFLSVAKKLSIGALSQQFPFRL